VKALARSAFCFSKAPPALARLARSTAASALRTIAYSTGYH
jgi:hypothetical protein